MLFEVAVKINGIDGTVLSVWLGFVVVVIVVVFSFFPPES